MFEASASSNWRTSGSDGQVREVRLSHEVNISYFQAAANVLRTFGFGAGHK